jgi:3-phenylpropionate/trans-cinnamate dioxygenase ferredoxin reductase subunit
VSAGPTVLIVGASLAGGRAAETLRAEGFDGRIVLVGEEPYRPYERPPLSKEALRGDAPYEKAFLRPEEWYAQNGVEMMLGTTAHMLDVNERTVMAGGTMLTYDALLLSTGGRARTLQLDGATLPNVFTLRTIDDSRAIGARLKPGARIVVVGAGFIGAEVAATARGLGCEVTLLEMAPVPLGRALGDELGAIFGDIHREHGVDLRTGVSIDRIDGDTEARRVVLAEGTSFDADAVVVGVGMEPNDEIALDAGIACDNGILVDEHLMTNVRGVFAAGDVANHPNPIVGHRARVEHWQNAQNQGAHVARAMLGDQTPWAEVPWFWSDQYEHTLQLAGHPLRWDEIVFRGDVSARDFSAWYLDGGRVIGALGVNRAKDVRAGKTFVELGARVEAAVLRDESVDLRALAKQLQQQRQQAAT